MAQLEVVVLLVTKVFEPLVVLLRVAIKFFVDVGYKEDQPHFELRGMPFIPGHDLNDWPLPKHILVDELLEFLLDYLEVPFFPEADLDVPTIGKDIDICNLTQVSLHVCLDCFIVLPGVVADQDIFVYDLVHLLHLERTIKNCLSTGIVSVSIVLRKILLLYLFEEAEILLIESLQIVNTCLLEHVNLQIVLFIFKQPNRSLVKLSSFNVLVPTGKSDIAVLDHSVYLRRKRTVPDFLVKRVYLLNFAQVKLLPHIAIRCILQEVEVNSLGNLAIELSPLTSVEVISQDPFRRGARQSH